MAASNYNNLNEAFDFSLDAVEFKQALCQKLERMMSASVQELDDDDLEFLNAAGAPFCMDDTDDEAERPLRR